MSFSWSTFALQAVNFLVLVWLLKRFLFKPVSAIAAQRAAEITRAQNEAEAARQSAEQMRKDFEARRSEIEVQRRGLMDQIRAEVAAEWSRMIEAAHADIQKLTAEAHKRLDEERESAVREITARSVQIAVQLAGQLLRQAAGPGLDEIFLKRVLDHLDHLTESERAALLGQSAYNGQLIVTTASQLDTGAEERWREMLNRHLGGPQHIAFAVDDGLIAGTELQFPHALLQFSWRHALADAQRELDQHEHAG